MRSVGAMRVHLTGVPNENCAFCNSVAASSIRGTAIDGVLVVEALAGRKEFDELIAHAGQSIV